MAFEILHFLGSVSKEILGECSCCFPCRLLQVNLEEDHICLFGYFL